MNHTTIQAKRVDLPNPTYRPVTQRNYRALPQVMAHLTEEERFAIDVVSTVLPFRANNYVVEQLINWDQVPDDPIYRLTFPHQGMLKPRHFNKMADLLRSGAPREVVEAAANEIRLQLNPHPAGQLEHNVPELDGQPLSGLQHKYRETVLFFPSQGQTCHAYCTFCFRWPQFVGMDGLKFAMKEVDQLIAYLRQHPDVTDVLFTGGDPMIMKHRNLATYIEPLLAADLPNLQTIRIGTKSLAYWPYRFLTDSDADETLDLFRKVSDRGMHLSIMAHFNHPQELRTDSVRLAVERVRETGAQIRTQSPIMRHINDNPLAWEQMWREQVQLGMVPYYMFIARNTGAQHYFAVPLVECWRTFKAAYQRVSGVARTVRGPSMSANPGKVQILGVSDIQDERVFVMRFIQGRKKEWVERLFYAQYDPDAIWLSDLKPAFGQKEFFFDRAAPAKGLERTKVLSL